MTRYELETHMEGLVWGVSGVITYSEAAFDLDHPRSISL